MNQECCLKSEEKSVCICSHEKMLSVIGKKWAILILRIINASRAAGYNEVFTQISGITPKAFGDKLKILENSGLVEKQIVSERPFRTEYFLTSDGQQLLTAMEPFFSETKTV
jgi:DNA-binding HxlR family transcriptional regulator